MFTNVLSKTLRLTRPAARRLQASSKSTMTSQKSFASGPSSSTSSPKTTQTYLTPDRKRDLISLYHQSEKFVTQENLSEYIDEEFTRCKQSFDITGARQEIERAELENMLADRRAKAKMVLKAEDNLDRSSTIRMSPNAPLDELKRRRDRRLKAAMYGLDESLKAGLEMVEEQRALSKAHDETS